MSKILPIFFGIACLLYALYDPAERGRASVVVLSQIKEYTSEEEPPSTGAKFYHIRKNKFYKTARVTEIENGKTKPLASYALTADYTKDEYLTLQFYPERDGRTWCAWLWRSPASQIPFCQGAVDDGWRLYNVSWNRKITLEGKEVLIDRILYCRNGEHLKNAELDRFFDTTSKEEIVEFTRSTPQCRVVILTFDTAQL